MIFKTKDKTYVDVMPITYEQKDFISIFETRHLQSQMVHAESEGLALYTCLLSQRRYICILRDVGVLQQSLANDST